MVFKTRGNCVNNKFFNTGKKKSKSRLVMEIIRRLFTLYLDDIIPLLEIV